MNARNEAELLNKYYNKGYAACSKTFKHLELKRYDNLLIEEVLKSIKQFINDNPCAIDHNTNRLIYAKRTKDGLVWEDVFNHFYNELQNKEQEDTMDGISNSTGLKFVDFLKNDGE